MQQSFVDDDPIPLIDVMEMWPHQVRGVDDVLTAVAAGVRRILVTSPTGGGKTLVMAKVAMAGLAEGWGVSLLANRKLLIDQMRKNLDNFGIHHGVRAANHVGDGYAKFQVSSIQTEYSRVVKRGTWDAHDCRMYIVDEAHANENKMSRRVYAKYADMGAVKIGFTATPLGLSGCYDVLIQAGTNSELRACGALVPAVHFGCTEPDLRNIGRVQVGEDLSDPQNVKAIMVPGIHGRVIDHFRRLNPHGLPSIGFAPGVPESVGFAEAFEKAGIPAAHIDGERLWVRGVEVLSTEESRRDLLEMSRTGAVRIVWNRFVLREAVDMPWLRHGILATVFGSLQSYLQSGGRLLRSCLPAGKADVRVQDHGGNWWRHGSLNADRHWNLGDTSAALAHERADDFTGDNKPPGEPKPPEPFLCPNCGTVVRLLGPAAGNRVRCGSCGYTFDFTRRSRPVLQADGELVEHPGNVFRPKRVERRDDTAAKWKKMYWRAKNSKSMTFHSAAGLFYHEHGYYPPRTLALMPKESSDWYLPVAKVAFTKLRKEES